MDAQEQSGGFYPPGSGPRDRDLGFLQALRVSLRSSIEAWPKAVYEEPFYEPRFPGAPIMLMDPALIRAVLVEQADIFPHGHLFHRLLRPVWGRGLAVAEEADWRWQRRAAAPPFRPAGLAALAPRMRAAAEAALARWRAGSGEPVDIVGETGTITFDVILDAMLSGGEDFERGSARSLVAAFLEQIRGMRLSYFLAPDGYHRFRTRPETAEARRLRAVVDQMIERRRRAPPRGDLLDLLMAAEDPETGRAMDDRILRDNLLGFIVAGYSTTALTLAWSIYLVSQHPPTAARLRAEIEEVTGGEPVASEHLGRLVFTRQVVNETLRLYPPAHSNTRICTRATTIGDIPMRAGRRVVMPIYALHRHRLWWRDPDRFDPDRFAPGEPAPDRHIYMPFGAGPRICIGAAFATTELVVTLATLIRAADFKLVPGHRVWPAAQLALAPEGGLPMTVTACAARPLPVQDAVG
jgi:cytochrome P450